MATTSKNSHNTNYVNIDNDRSLYDIQADLFYTNGILPNVKAMKDKCDQNSEALTDITDLENYLTYFFTKDLPYKAPELRAHTYNKMWKNIISYCCKYEFILSDFNKIKEIFNIIFKDGFNGCNASANDNNTTSEDAAPEDTAPEDTAPEDAVPEDAVPEDAVPEDAVPEDDT